MAELSSLLELGQPNAEVPANAPPGPLEILFVMRTLSHQLRFFQSSLELLVERGHNVRLLLESDAHGTVEQSWLDTMQEQANFVCDTSFTYKWDPWQRRGRALRAGMEYVHFLGAEYRGERRYVLNVLRRSPPATIRRLAALPMVRATPGRRLLYRALSALETAVSSPARAIAYLDCMRPDVVVIPDPGSRSSVYVAFTRAAMTRGTPAAIIIPSWDNLSTRPRMRVVPHLLAVWNETQVREAVELHGIPLERIVVTGAPNFDQWFEWKPRPAREFLTRVGLDPEKPVILWVGSAINGWERREPTYVRPWLEALRSAEDPALREAGVLLRPHPLRLHDWHGLDLSEYGNVAMWPRAEMTMPVDDAQKADYYDSIYHSRAVVGINTSAMIEAAIIGRPVLSILEPDYHDSQFGSLHFPYLLEQGGGALRLADSLPEHLDQLSSILSDSDPRAGENARRFVNTFVRPHGLEQPATPILVHQLEQLAGQPVQPQPEPHWTTALRALIRVVMFLGADDGIARSQRRRKKVAKRLRKEVTRQRLLKRLRRLRRLTRNMLATRLHRHPLAWTKRLVRYAKRGRNGPAVRSSRLPTSSSPPYRQGSESAGERLSAAVNGAPRATERGPKA